MWWTMQCLIISSHKMFKENESESTKQEYEDMCSSKIQFQE